MHLAEQNQLNSKLCHFSLVFISILAIKTSCYGVDVYWTVAWHETWNAETRCTSKCDYPTCYEPDEIWRPQNCV